MAKIQRRKKEPEWEDIKILSGGHLSNPSFRNMVCNVHNGCYVEAEHTKQGGTVVDIIKDFCGRAACLKVKFIYDEGENGEQVMAYDFIPVDRVTFYEPYNYYESNDEYDWESNEAMIEHLLANGYEWDDEVGYINRETGDTVIW